MKRVSVVIPNYNGAKFLCDCLDSFRKQDTDEFEIIVVDNNSEDDSKEILSNYSEVKLIELDKNYGFCRGVNEGIRASELEYVLLLNNDMTVECNFVREMIEFMDCHKDAFSAQAKMLQMYAPERIDDAGDFYCALGWAFARGKDKSAANYDEVIKTFASCAGAAIYRKEALNETGYFDESHFAYLEDIDLGYRAKILGYNNYYNPKAVIYHVGSGASGSRHNEFKVSLSSRNSVYLAYKNMPVIQLIVNIPFLILGHIVKIVFFARKKLAKTYVKGVLNGVKMCKKDKKFPFKVENTLNYVKIQFELWGNIVNRVRF